MDVGEAATRWARTWEAAWRAHDVEPIAALYAEGCVYRAHPLRPPERSAADYARRAFAEETDADPRFGAPIVQANRAAVEWWCALTEEGKPVTLAGCTLLRFDSHGLVVRHQDYWHVEQGHHQPPDGWGT